MGCCIQYTSFLSCIISSLFYSSTLRQVLLSILQRKLEPWGFLLFALGLCSVMSFQPHGLEPTRLLCPWDCPDKNTGMGCHFLLQEIFSTQGSRLCLLCVLQWQTDCYHCVIWEAPKGLNGLPDIPQLVKRQIKDLARVHEPAKHRSPLLNNTSNDLSWERQFRQGCTGPVQGRTVQGRVLQVSWLDWWQALPL